MLAKKRDMMIEKRANKEIDGHLYFYYRVLDVDVKLGSLSCNQAGD